MVPAPRAGLDGTWDRLVGPGAGTLEQVAVLAGAVAGAVVGATRPRRPLERALGAAIGADAGGGVIANETASVKAWYRRPDAARWEPVAFAAVHVYPFVAEWASGRRAWRQAAIAWALPVVATGVIVAAREADPRPTAAVLAAGVATAGTALAPPGWRWLPPLLAVKLVLGHPTPPGRLARLLRPAGR